MISPRILLPSWEARYFDVASNEASSYVLLIPYRLVREWANPMLMRLNGEHQKERTVEIEVNIPLRGFASDLHFVVKYSTSGWHGNGGTGRCRVFVGASRYSWGPSQSSNIERVAAHPDISVPGHPRTRLDARFCIHHTSAWVATKLVTTQSQEMACFSEPRGEEGSCHLPRCRMTGTVAPVLHPWDVVPALVLFCGEESTAMILSAINAEARSVPDRQDEETRLFLREQGCAWRKAVAHCGS